MSYSRYSNAGIPGSGVTVDNMASRVKQVGRVAQTAGPATLSAGFNVSSITDDGVGTATFYFTLPMASAAYACQATASGASVASASYNSQLVGSYNAIGLNPANGGGTAATDVGFLTVSAHGALAGQ